MNITIDNQQKIQSYIAGLFDAEGWFSFHKQQNKYWNPMIGFINTRFELIDFYKKFLETNGIKYYATVRRRKSWHKIQTSLIIEGDPQVKKWLDLIEPKLLIKKKQAEVVKKSLETKPINRSEYRKEFQGLLKNEIDFFEKTNKEWIMGFWQGDGGAYIVRRNYKKDKIKYIPNIRFYNTSVIMKNSIEEFFKKENISYYIERYDKDRNKTKYVISIVGLKRCLKFIEKFKELDLSGKLLVIEDFCERRLSLPLKTPYSELDFMSYERLKILNDYTTNYQR